ncbi:DUF4105 domain-containing protein [Ruegeria lacuscaerulensis]|uniref:Lnb N-terminal periplasmic domain-containing protein n=1 Tax=Ruegeria lacuscaerulensis TaxID=55218 RepID=UPI00147D86AD|nr:DUF4105 domain-containing protein [Ruegeria lacuscaerulensis]
MRTVLNALCFPLLFLVVAYSTVWGTLALWFKFSVPELIRLIAIVSFIVVGLGTLVSIFRRSRWRWLSGFAVYLAAILIWWNSLTPPSDGNWSPDVVRTVTGEISGNTLTLNDVRAFEWQSADTFEEKWITREYDLSQIESVDLFMSYWGGPEMAHLMLSFGFSDGRYLTWSIEVRRQVGESFSPVADFFKAHPIVMIAAEERDVVGLRSNVRKEKVHLFRLRGELEERIKLISAYVEAANEIAERPRWFNSVFTNCSRSAILIARHVGISVPVDYRVVINGYFPDYLYEQGLTNTEIDIQQLYSLGDITANALANGLDEGYSAAIRKDVPVP